MLYNKRKGFTLVELLIGLALGAIFWILAIRAFSAISNLQKRKSDEVLASTQSKQVSLYFRGRFSGSKSFSNLGFHVPNTNFNSLGPGFYVHSNSSGPATPKTSDTLYVVNSNGVTFTLPPGIQFQQFNSSETRLLIPAAGWPQNPPQVGEYQIISRIQRCDLARVVEVVPNPAAPAIPFIKYSTNSTVDNLSPNYSPNASAILNPGSTYQAIYSPGDTIYNADITEISLNANGALTTRDLRSNAPRELDTQIEQFTVEYSNNNPLQCTGSNTNGAFSHDWAQINAPNCYQFIERIKINIVKSGKTESLEFRVN